MQVLVGCVGGYNRQFCASFKLTNQPFRELLFRNSEEGWR